MAYAGGIGVASLGFMAVSAAHLQTSLNLAGTQMTNTARGVGTRSQGLFRIVLSQMKQFPAAAQDMSKSLYDIFSGTQVHTLSQGAALLKNSTLNQAAVAGQTDLNTATQAGITILNNYGHSVKDMPGLMNKMFAAVRFGRTDFTQFATALGQIVPAFHATHQTAQTMLSTFAFLTRLFPSTAQASVSASRAIELLGNQKMIEGLKKVHVHITNARGELLQFPTVIDRILKKFPGLATGAMNIQTFIHQMTGTVGYVQARRGLQQAFAHADLMHTMFSQVAKDRTSFLSRTLRCQRLQAFSGASL